MVAKLTTELTRFQRHVYELCRKVPKGRVTTYKEIAKAMKTKAYRAVGQALRQNPFAPRVPCHRIVCSDGSLGGFAGKMKSEEKIVLLEKEGIKIKDNKILEFKKKRICLAACM